MSSSTGGIPGRLAAPRLHAPTRVWRWIAALIIIGLGALAVRLWLARPVEAPPPVAEPRPVLVAASGMVLPQRRAELSFTTGGRISQIYVSEGQVVTAGQPLARLDPASMAADPRVGGGDAYLNAPFAGTVGLIHLRQWETAVAGQPVVALGDLSALRIEVEDLAESDLGQVQVGQPVEISFEAFPDRTERGILTHVAPMAVQAGGRSTYRLIVEFANGVPPGVRWGMTANVDIIVAPSGG